MSKYNNQVVGKFRSKFELRANALIATYQLPYTYEEMKITLMEGFKFTNESFQKWGKTYKDVVTVRAMTYTPDFIVADKYFIEIKGMKTESFNIK